jgi:hypothetical protein
VIGVVGSLLTQLLVGACLLSPIVFFLSLAAFLHLLPAFVRFCHWCVRATLILSYRLYALILGWLAPVIRRVTGIDPRVGWPRLGATLLLSAAIGIAILLVTHLPFNGWSATVIVIHGLAVGLAWDEIASPGGLQLGERIQ